MLHQNWFLDSRKFIMIDDTPDVQEFFNTETKCIYVVSKNLEKSTTIREIEPEAADYEAYYRDYEAAQQKILDAINLVCLNCVEDTLSDENICSNCPVRKTSIVIFAEKEENHGL